MAGAPRRFSPAHDLTIRFGKGKTVKSVYWIVYDMNRAGDPAAFDCAESAQAYKARKARETGGRWVIRFRFRDTGNAIEGRPA